LEAGLLHLYPVLLLAVAAVVVAAAAAALVAGTLPTLHHWGKMMMMMMIHDDSPLTLNLQWMPKGAAACTSQKVTFPVLYPSGLWRMWWLSRQGAWGL